MSHPASRRKIRGTSASTRKMRGTRAFLPPSDQSSLSSPTKAEIKSRWAGPGGAAPPWAAVHTSVRTTEEQKPKSWEETDTRKNKIKKTSFVRKTRNAPRVWIHGDCLLCLFMCFRLDFVVNKRTRKGKKEKRSTKTAIDVGRRGRKNATKGMSVQGKLRWLLLPPGETQTDLPGWQTCVWWCVGSYRAGDQQTKYGSHRTHDPDASPV